MAPASIDSKTQADSVFSSKSDQYKKASKLISSKALSVIKTLAVFRIGIGAVTLIAPRWTSALFAYYVPADMALLGRLFAVRDTVIGELIYTAENKEGWDGGRRELRRALWASFACDTVDICSTLFGLAAGEIEWLPAALFGVGAAVFSGMAALGLLWM